MVLLIIDSEEPSIDQTHNDFLQYQHRHEVDSDSGADWSSLSDDAVWIERVLHPTGAAFRRIIPIVYNAWHFKDKCAAVLSRAGVLRPKLKLDEWTGKCSACSGMEAFLSPFSHVELGAAAGCPSCALLMEGVHKYCPGKSALWGSQVYVMDSWNSGCAGRQFIRTTKNKSARSPGAMGVTIGLEGGLELKQVVTGPDGRVMHRFGGGAPEFEGNSLRPKRGSRKRVVELNFFGTANDPASWDNVGLAYHISGDTSSDAAFQWFQDRLDHCVREHALCKTPGSRGKLPTRVLDLGRVRGHPETNADVRLVESEGARGRYVCLSYCWGGTIDVRLTKARYESYTTKGISWAALPQGYRDAIHLTRKLGIRYLWIDSLCIIQDDDNDWKQQASKMAPIYQGAHVTIAATKATNPNDGYFSISPPQYLATRLSHLSADGSTTHHAYVRRTIPHFFSSTASAAEPNPSRDPSSSPLLRRGWVFQERLLSPRMLHLGAVELAWECNEACACECMGETQTYASEPRWAHTKGSHARNLAAARAEGREVHADWRSTVENYTRTELTFGKDVFPAISGVVKNMQRYREDRYLAGIWSASVLDDLAWRVADSTRPRPETWLAPTWSWASVGSPVSYENYRTMLSDEYIQRTEPLRQPTLLVDASVTPTGSDPRAEVCAGYLALLGPVLAARLVAEEGDDNQRSYYVQYGAERLAFTPDYDFSAPGPSNVPAGSAVSVLFLCREPDFKDSHGKDTKTKAFSLVLRRVEEDGEGGNSNMGSDQSRRDGDMDLPEDGTYERIGLHCSELEQGTAQDYVEANGVECVVKLM